MLAFQRIIVLFSKDNLEVQIFNGRTLSAGDFQKSSISDKAPSTSL